MKNNSISSLKIAAAYIGTVVGAGFATGQEILQFFAGFGTRGLWGILISTILFIVFGVIIMEIGYSLSAVSHSDILRYSGGKIFGKTMDYMISFFLFTSLAAMMAGTGALFTQQFRLSSVLGSVIMAVLTTLTVLGGFSGVINSISAVVPFLMVSVIGISILSMAQNPPNLQTVFTANENPFIGNWLLSAILYTSYNIIMSIAVLGPLGACAKDKKTLRNGAILGGLGLGVASVMICFALSGSLDSVKDLDVPLSSIAGGISPGIQLAFSVVLIAEVYTTAVGSLYGFTARIVSSRISLPREITITGVSIAAFLASMLGFSNIVKYIYPLVGYCGIALLINLLYQKAKPGIPRVCYCRPKR